MQRTPSSLKTLEVFKENFMQKQYNSLNKMLNRLKISPNCSLTLFISDRKQCLRLGTLNRGTNNGN